MPPISKWNFGTAERNHYGMDFTKTIIFNNDSNKDHQEQQQIRHSITTKNITNINDEFSVSKSISQNNNLKMTTTINHSDRRQKKKFTGSNNYNINDNNRIKRSKKKLTKTTLNGNNTEPLRRCQ
jgi:hypothetical protein